MTMVTFTFEGPRNRPSTRACIAGALDTLGLLDRFLWLRARVGAQILTVLTYHRIANANDIGDLDKDVRETDGPGLSDQIAVIKAHGTIVPLRDVRRFLRGDKIPKNPVLLAFDDGYRECIDVALPVLQRASAPATFFVPTAYPDSGRLFWWDRISLLVRRSRAQSVTLRYPCPLTIEPAADPERAKRVLLRIVKHTPGLDLGRFFEELELAAGVSLSAEEEREIAGKTILSWRQVRSLRDAGMDVASHSHSHRVLTTLSPEQALSDLRTSRQMLDEVLGQDVRTVAYPVGYKLNGPFLKAAEEAGFDVGFTNAAGLCLLGRDERLNVPRISVGQEDIGALYKWLLLVGQRPPGAGRFGFSGKMIS